MDTRRRGDRSIIGRGDQQVSRNIGGGAARSYWYFLFRVGIMGVMAGVTLGNAALSKLPNILH